MERMIEKAKEELEMLEKQHPQRFDYLKLDLQSFISLLQAQQIFLDPLPTTSITATQASTSMKTKSMRKRECTKRRKLEDEIKINKNNNKKQKDRVEVVLERAEACLRKIQDLKFSLIC